MDLIKQWILSLCGATAITGIFQVFLANTNFKKVINVFLSIFILFYTVIPLSDIETNTYNFDFENMELSEFSKESYEQIIEITIEKICAENNVGVISVNIDSYISDNCLNVEKINIQIDIPDKAEEIKSILKEKTGFEVNVY